MEDTSEVISTPKTSKKNRLDSAVFWIISAIAFLLPIIFIPISGLSFALGKAALLSLGVTLALVVWVIARLQTGSIALPRTWLIPALLGVLLVSFVSALFSDVPTVSLFGDITSVDTVVMLGVMVVLAFLAAMVFISRGRTIFLFSGSASVLGLLGIFHSIRFFFGAESVFPNLFGGSLATPLGQWNDLGVLFGLSLLVSVIVLSMAQLRKLHRILLYLLFLISLCIVLVINLTVVWAALAVFSLVFLVYLVSIRFVRQASENKAETHTIGVILAGILIVFSLVAIISGGRLGDSVARVFEVNQTEARPSWNGTITIAKSVIKEAPLLGTGPNRFQNAWLLNKPIGVNQTVFWETDFGQGVGRIPSAMVTLGTLGTIAWVLFLGTLLSLGFKALFGEIVNKNRLTMLFVFLTTLYLWLFALAYTPGIVVYALTFLSTGVFIGALVREGVIKTQTAELGTRPSWNFVIVLLSVLCIVGGLLWVYIGSERVLARGLYERSVAVFGATGDASSAERGIARALSFHELDRYYRSLAEVRVRRLSVIVSEPNISDEVRRSEFQETLAAAIAAAQSAVHYDPTNYRNYITLGGVYEALVPAKIEGAYEGARGAYEEALKVNPLSPSLYLMLARLEANNGSMDVARTEIGNALARKPNYTEAIFLLSQIEVAEGNIQRAIQAVEAATIISPNDPVVYFQLGLLRYNNDSFTGAIGAFENALRLNPSYSNARYFLGLSYDKVGRSADAIIQFEEIERLNPGNEEVAFILSNLREGRSPFANAQPPIDDEPEARDTLPIEEDVESEQ